ncbi:hypothetical protein [Chlorobium sp. KB01]|uniref:hypothetical protein n=1 Tax=Chlorobium sp. KB01 TaxID=1917528 RepID=UPI0009769727|nr:hypothetical protein [Chlorobium sp. KB01]
MRMAFFIMAMVFVSPNIFAADFRTSSWGDRKDAVIQQEGTPSNESTGTAGWNQGLPQLVYNDRSVIGRIATVIYTFDGDSLVMGRYALGGAVGLLETEAAMEIKELTAAVTKKYGKATTDINGAQWIIGKGYINLYKIKLSTGTFVLLDYWEKTFFDYKIADREEL